MGIFFVEKRSDQNGKRGWGAWKSLCNALVLLLTQEKHCFTVSNLP